MKNSLLTPRALGFALTLGLAHSQTIAQFKPSKAEQVKLGAEYAKKIEKEYKILPDTDPRVILLRKIGQELLDTRSEQVKKTDPYQYRFNVIDSKEVNAFALPGGPIYFFTGLIDRMTTMDELAGVLGHELVHVQREHWASAVNASQTRSAGIILLGAIFGANRDTMTAAQVLNQFGADLPNGRKQERESDSYGFAQTVAAGYNPEGMIRVFQMFQKLKGSGGAPEFLSTHPDDKDRIKRIKQYTAEYAKRKDFTGWPELRPLPFETAAMRAESAPKAPGSGSKAGGTRKARSASKRS